MHSRRLACLLLGIWLAGGIFLAFVTRQNLRGADGLMDHPSPAALVQLKPMDPAATRLLLRHQASEQNRLYFETWELAQLVLGIFFFFFLLFGTTVDKYTLALPLLMLMITAAQRFVMTPEMTALGRVTDFLPGNVHSAYRIKLLLIQTGYSGAEVVKGGLGVILALRLVLADWWGSSRRRDARQQLDLVDKANYGHVNR